MATAGESSTRLTVRTLGSSGVEEIEGESALVAPSGDGFLDTKPTGLVGDATVGTTTAPEHFGHLTVRPAYWSLT